MAAFAGNVGGIRDASGDFSDILFGTASVMLTHAEIPTLSITNVQEIKNAIRPDRNMYVDWSSKSLRSHGHGVHGFLSALSQLLQRFATQVTDDSVRSEVISTLSQLVITSESLLATTRFLIAALASPADNLGSLADVARAIAVTLPLVAQGPVLPQKWECLSCTFVNEPSDQVCSMCESPKPQVAPQVRVVPQRNAAELEIIMASTSTKLGAIQVILEELVRLADNSSCLAPREPFAFEVSADAVHTLAFLLAQLRDDSFAVAHSLALRLLRAQLARLSSCRVAPIVLGFSQPVFDSLLAALTDSERSALVAELEEGQSLAALPVDTDVFLKPWGSHFDAAGGLDLAVNFGPSNTLLPGYVLDEGKSLDENTGLLLDEAFPVHFGWVANCSAFTRDRSKEDNNNRRRGVAPTTHDLVKNTVVHMVSQSGAWTLRLPNGNYWVTSVVGDSSFASRAQLFVNDVEVVKGVQLGLNQFEAVTTLVRVTDGVITLRGSGTTDKSAATRLCAVRVRGSTLSPAHLLVRALMGAQSALSVSAFATALPQLVVKLEHAKPGAMASLSAPTPAPELALLQAWLATAWLRSATAPDPREARSAVAGAWIALAVATASRAVANGLRTLLAREDVPLLSGVAEVAAGFGAKFQVALDTAAAASTEAVAASEWVCAFCERINAPSQLNCELCDSPRPPVSPQLEDDSEVPPASVDVLQDNGSGVSSTAIAQLLSVQ